MVSTKTAKIEPPRNIMISQYFCSFAKACREIFNLLLSIFQLESLFHKIPVVFVENEVNLLFITY